MTAEQKQVLTATSLRKTFQSCNGVSGLGLITEEGPYMIANTILNASSPYANTSLLWTFANQTLPKGQAPPRYVTVSVLTSARDTKEARICMDALAKHRNVAPDITKVSNQARLPVSSCLHLDSHGFARFHLLSFTTSSQLINAFVLTNACNGSKICDTQSVSDLLVAAARFQKGSDWFRTINSLTYLATKSSFFYKSSVKILCNLDECSSSTSCDSK